MSNKEDLYVFIENEGYRNSRSQILESEADLLRIMKNMQNLQILGRQKADLKSHLHTQFEVLLGELNLMERNLPKTPPMRVIEVKEITFEEKEMELSKHDSIDAELREIQEKLRILNS